MSGRYVKKTGTIGQRIVKEQSNKNISFLESLSNDMFYEIISNIDNKDIFNLYKSSRTLRDKCIDILSNYENVPIFKKKYTIYQI